MKAFAFLSFFLQVALMFAADDNRPKWVPKNALRIELSERFLLAKNLDPQICDLGVLQTNQEYFVEVSFVNLLDEAVKIAEVKSSCGCITGVRNDRDLPPKAESSFVLRVKTDVSSKDLAKKVTISTNTGVSNVFLISAKVVSPFSLTPTRLKVRGSDAINLVLTKTGNGGVRLEDLDVKALAGFLQVTNVEVDNEGRLLLMLEPCSDYEASHVSRVERIAISRRDSGEIIAEHVVLIESSLSFAVRPAQLNLTLKDGLYIGQVLVYGGEDGIRDLPDSQIVDFNRGDGSHIKGEATIISKERRRASMQVEFTETSIAGLDSVFDGKKFPGKFSGLGVTGPLHFEK